MNRATSSLLRVVAVCGAVFALTISPVRLQAQDASAPMTEHAHAMTPPSTTLTITVDGKSTVLSVAELQALPQKTIAVHNEHTKMDENYSGVPLGDLLAKYGFAVSQATHRTMLRSYVVATGMDKYWVLYSATEVESSEHAGDVIVAIAKDGKPLGEDGLLKLISSEDKKPQRWVRNLTAITLKSAE